MSPKLSASFIHAQRRIVRTLRDRASMSNSLVTPVVMLVIMRLLFGDFIAASQGRETPDLAAITVLMALGAQWMNSTYCASETIRERQAGFTARIAVSPGGTLPMVVGDAMYYALRFIITGSVTLLVGIALGARFSGADTVAVVIGVVLISGVVTSLLSTWMAYITNNSESLMMIAPLLMTLLFLSGGIVDASSFVAAIRPVVRNNPVTHLVEGILALNAGTDPGNHLLIALMVAVGAGVVCTLGAVRAYSRTRAHLA